MHCTDCPLCTVDCREHQRRASTRLYPLRPFHTSNSTMKIRRTSKCKTHVHTPRYEYVTSHKGYTLSKSNTFLVFCNKTTNERILLIIGNTQASTCSEQWHEQRSINRYHYRLAFATVRMRRRSYWIFKKRWRKKVTISELCSVWNSNKSSSRF